MESQSQTWRLWSPLWSVVTTITIILTIIWKYQYNLILDGAAPQQNHSPLDSIGISPLLDLISISSIFSWSSFNIFNAFSFTPSPSTATFQSSWSWSSLWPSSSSSTSNLSSSTANQNEQKLAQSFVKNIWYVFVAQNWNLNQLVQLDFCHRHNFQGLLHLLLCRVILTLIENGVVVVSCMWAFLTFWGERRVKQSCKKQKKLSFFAATLHFLTVQ